MTRWGVAIDLRQCIGCKSCVAACMETHPLAEQRLRQIHDCGIGLPPARERLFLPSSCMHCAHPPCLGVCPTGANSQRPDGIVTIDEDRCLGCGYCIVACPYRARQLFLAPLVPGVSRTDQEDGHQQGVCVKCDFCLEKIEEGLANGLLPGVDAEASPNCLLTCTGKALYFGDLDEQESPLAHLLRDNRTWRLQEELGTEANIFYLLPESWAGRSVGGKGE
jgi:phenylacetyl-CoA:acceptor oxidoreductase 27-kDa subunit